MFKAGTTSPNIADVNALLSHLQVQYVNVQIEMRAEGPLSIEHMVLDGQVDFGLGTHPPDHPGLEYILWRKSNLTAIAPEGHPLSRLETVTLEQLAEHPLLLLIHDMSRKDDRAAIEQAFRRVKLLTKRRILMETSNSEIIACYVEAGLGIGIVSETALLGSHRKVTPLNLETPIGGSEVGILIRKEKIITPEMRTLFLLIDPKLEDWISKRVHGKQRTA